VSKKIVSGNNGLNGNLLEMKPNYFIDLKANRMETVTSRIPYEVEPLMSFL